jgi:hypothetical protein
VPPLSPCGLAVDWLRSCYRTRANFGPDFQSVEIKWYFVDNRTPFLPFPNVFTSLNWTDRGENVEPTNRGEIWAALRPYYAGSKVGDGPGLVPCGPPDWWINGVPAGTPAAILDAAGTPLCCFPTFLRRWRGLVGDRDAIDRDLLAVIIKAHGRVSDRGRPESIYLPIVRYLGHAESLDSVAAAGSGLVRANGRCGSADRPASPPSPLYRGDAEDAARPRSYGSYLIARKVSDHDLLTATRQVRYAGEVTDRDSPLKSLTSVVYKGDCEDADNPAKDHGPYLVYAYTGDCEDASKCHAGSIRYVWAGKVPDRDKPVSARGVKWSGKVPDVAKPVSGHAQFDMVTPTGACGSLPSVLVVRFSGGTGTCTCANGVSITLTWNGTQWTSGFVTICGVTNLVVSLVCAAAVWVLHIDKTLPPTHIVANMTGTSGAIPNLTGTMTATTFCSGTFICTLTRT